MKRRPHSFDAAFRVPAPSPDPVVSEAEILAGCRVVYPGLFRDGLGPEPLDGPATVRQMEETVKRVRAILTAALKVRTGK